MNYKEFNKRLDTLNKTVSLDNRMVPKIISSGVYVEPRFLSLKRLVKSGDSDIDVNLMGVGYLETHFDSIYQENDALKNYAVKVAELCMQFAMTPVQCRFINSKEV